MSPLVAAALGACAGFTFAWWFFSRNSRHRIRELADQLAACTPDHSHPQLSGAAFPSFIPITQAANGVIAEYRRQLNQLTQQRFELDSILTSMVEGVIAVDTQRRLFTINLAAAEMFGASPERVRGQQLIEVVRNPHLQDLVQLVLETGGSHHAEFVLHGEQERTLRAQGAALRGSDHSMLGAVVVLEDITQLKRLENIRRDFVANVSHELKTPITSIKGYIETIVDGHADDPADLARFLEIVAKQSDRLNAIIDDLLALAHVEQIADSHAIRLSIEPLQPVLAESIELASSTARDRDVTIELKCPLDLQAPINPPLLEQAVTNLVNNACKYSPPRSTVRVTARETPLGVSIEVADEGCGIEAQHLPRLFERFYRVDKSRSRKLGGTGLGLAIVKHIAQVHGGDVTVQSKPGEGSRFSINLGSRNVPPHDIPDG